MISERMSRRGRVLLGILLIAAVLAGCGPGPGGTGITVSFPPDENTTINLNAQADFLPVTGQILFEDIFIDGENPGAGVQEVTRPVRAADVVTIDAATGREIQLAPVSTDDNGNFMIFTPKDRSFFVRIKAAITVRSDRVSAVVFSSPLTNDVYTQDLGNADGSPIDLTGSVGFDGDPFTIPRRDTVDTILGPLTIRPSAPFNILDAVLTAADSFRNQTGAAPPGPIALYWNELITDGTFFSPSYGTAGTPGIQIAGGDSNTLNTDEFDDGVIQHEFGHFIAFSTSRDSSLGLSHSPDDDLYPSLGWSEGFANFFSGFARGRPSITDTAKLTGAEAAPAQGPLFAEIDLEDFALPVTGLGVEGSVFEVLWDLADGNISGLPDTDGDPVQLSIPSLFQPFFDLRTQNPRPYVDFYEYLINVVNRGILSAAQIDNLLNVTPEDQNIPFNPIPPGEVFPQPIVINDPPLDEDCVTRANGDGQNTGVDLSNRFRTFTLAGTTALTVTLVNTTTNLNPGLTGQNANGTNLEFRVRTVDNVLATNVDTGLPLTPNNIQESAIESVTGRLAPGTYVIVVTGAVLNPSDPDPATNRLNASSEACSITLQVTSP